jgi:2-oxoglutarate dehydrogenase complex dehydrogenase (E1) component-like enzyme
VLVAARLAIKYRKTFGRDVVIELIGYRRHGLNEVRLWCCCCWAD